LNTNNPRGHQDAHDLHPRSVPTGRAPEEETIRGRKKFFREPPPQPDHRINERIRWSPVRVIDADGEQVGVIPVEEARSLARDAGLDLVEVAPDARPPVCKIMDYGRFVYNNEKKAKQAKRHQHRIDTKEVKFRPNISGHDFETKVRRAESFLKKGCQVKLTVMFRMRELRRPENGYDLLHRATEMLADSARVENPPPERLQGRDLSMVLKPA
jgi:translation initiation factor IF-3